MSIQVITGNIFTSECQTLVNTINCVGVMGAGIALECRLRYPEMYDKYVEFCKEGKIKPGILWLYKSEEKWILNFPTKLDWKRPSKVEYLHAGLKKFRETYEYKGIQSIAFPLLGADKGGIPASVSESILLSYLDSLPIHVEIYHYDPTAYDELFEGFKHWFEHSNKEHLKTSLRISDNILSKITDALSSGEIRQLNQLRAIKGIGDRTLEKVFHASKFKTSDIDSQKALDF
jgi:O-acetyl-ADP-ribose deacetylase (regulator of RNase III)